MEGSLLSGRNFLETLVNMESARAAAYTPFRQEMLLVGGARPREIVSYNLHMRRHFETQSSSVSGSDKILPHRFCDLSIACSPLVYTAFNACAHLNGYKGELRGRPPGVVRTFVEVLHADTSRGWRADVTPALRVHHVLWAAPRAEEAAPGPAAAAGGDGEGASEAEAGSGSESDDMEVDAAGDDEEEVRRAERRAATKKKKQKAVETGEAKRATFAAGFQAVLAEAQQYAYKKREIDQREAARADYAQAVGQVPSRSVRDFERQMHKFEGALETVTTAKQYTDVMQRYLKYDTRATIVSPHGRQGAVINTDDEGFADTRKAADYNPAAAAAADANAGRFDSYELYKGAIDPSVVLGPETAMAYHTQFVGDDQRSLFSYYDISEEQMDAVLALAHVKEHGAEAPMGVPAARADLGQLFGGGVEDDEQLAADPTSHMAKHARVQELLLRSVDRLEYMTALRVKASDFARFPHPENVYELRRDFARPEVLWRLPLPQAIGAILSPNATAIAQPGHLEYVADLMRALDIERRNNAGQKVRLIRDAEGAVVEVDAGDAVITRATALARFTEQRIALANELQRVCHEYARDKEVRMLTPRRLVAVLRDATLAAAQCGPLLRLMTELRAASHLYREFPRLVDKAADGVRFRAVFEADYHDAMFTATVPVAQREELERAAARGEAQVAQLAQPAPEEDDEAAFHQEVDEQYPDDEPAELAAAQGRGGAASSGAAFLQRVPPEIIERDEALQLNIKNSEAYASLMYRASHGEGMARETFESLFWTRVREATHDADDLWHNGEKVDDTVKALRKWYAGLTPKQRRVEFRMPYAVRPYMAFRIWVNESMASPVLNLAQNTTAMAIAFFASLHHCRWYEHNRDPKLNFLMAGDGMSGKSYIIHSLEEILPPGIISTATHTSSHAMHVPKIMDGVCYLHHEFQHRYLFPAMPGKDGAPGESGDALNFFKDRLTRGQVSIVILDTQKDPKTKKSVRTQNKFDASCQTVTIGGTNDPLKDADANVLTRFIVLSVPKPRDIAEGSHPSERPDFDEMDGKKMVADHFSQRTRLYHQLLRYRCAYTEFMLKCGVLPNGMQTFGARLLIDNILNEMNAKYSIDTRDPRKRKMTEEMAREMHLMFANYMGLGSPFAMAWEREHPGDGEGRWSWDAWLHCVVPFLYTGKDGVIDALTLLESLWSPQYLTRILFTVVFHVARVQELAPEAFRSVYRPSVSGGDGDKPGRFTPADFDVDYNYIQVCERHGSKTNLIARIADACGSFGIRAADIEAFLHGLSKQYISTRRIVRRSPVPAHVPATTPSTAPAGIDAIPAAFKELAAAAPRPATTANGFLRESLSQESLDRFPKAHAPMGVPAAPPLPVPGAPLDLADGLRGVMDQHEKRMEDAMDPDAMDLDASQEYAMDLDESQESAMARRTHEQLVRAGRVGKSESEKLVRSAVVDSSTSERAPPPPPPDRVVHGSDGTHLEYDKSSPVTRLQISRFESIHPGNPKSGCRLLISTAYCEGRLKFSVCDPAGMRDLCAKDVKEPHKKLPNEVATPGDARYRWGEKCTLNWMERVATARKMRDASADVTSPVLKCIESVIGNVYLEKPPEDDAVANEILSKLRESYNAQYAANTDPGKNHHYPWLSYVTSIPVSDYTFKSGLEVRFPDGRRVPFHDMLKVLDLTADPANTRPIYRNNYTQLSLYARDIIDFQPLEEIVEGAGLRVQESGEFLSSRVRYSIMNNARAFAYDVDLDYCEAVERMNSLAHPGFPFTTFPRLIAWPPATYHFVQAFNKMWRDEKISMRFEQLHDNPDTIVREFGLLRDDKRLRHVYPEDDPTLELEYPTHQIVKRIREFEHLDTNESTGNMEHAVFAGRFYSFKNTVAGIYCDTDKAVTDRAAAAATAAAQPQSAMGPPPAVRPVVGSHMGKLTTWIKQSKRVPHPGEIRQTSAQRRARQARPPPGAGAPPGPAPAPSAGYGGQKRARPADSDSTDGESGVHDAGTSLAERMFAERKKRARTERPSDAIADLIALVDAPAVPAPGSPEPDFDFATFT
jgi:hypothetical protein